MFIYLNKQSRAGLAGKLWRIAERRLADKFPGERLSVVTDPDILESQIEREYERGERKFLAAGGDGTVSALLNGIMNLGAGRSENIILGAVGLGSSNDFHKPFSEKSQFENRIPFKLDFENPGGHNVGQISFIDENNKARKKYFMINCSLGIVALANYIFNNPSRTLKMCKSRFTSAAIWYAGLKALIESGNFRCRIFTDSRNMNASITNLGILIKPNFSGGFRYDIDVDHLSNYLGVAICEDLGVLSRVRIIRALANSKFHGLPGTLVWKTESISVVPAGPAPFEFDGEVVMAREIKIKLLKKAIIVCA